MQEAAAPRATGRFKKEDTRAWQVLQHAPALVPFEDRARLFQTKVAESRHVQVCVCVCVNMCGCVYLRACGLWTCSS